MRRRAILCRRFPIHRLVSFLVQTGQLRELHGFVIESVRPSDQKRHHGAGERRQEEFLDEVQYLDADVQVYLLSGIKLSGRITAFDKYSLLLDSGGGEQLVFKHAISNIVRWRLPRAVEVQSEDHGTVRLFYISTHDRGLDDAAELKRLLGVLRDDGITKVVVDLANAKAGSAGSAQLATFLQELIEYLRRRKGRLVLSSAQKSLRDEFSHYRHLTRLNVYRTSEEAVRALDQPPSKTLGAGASF